MNILNKLGLYTRGDIDSAFHRGECYGYIEGSFSAYKHGAMARYKIRDIGINKNPFIEYAGTGHRLILYRDIEFNYYPASMKTNENENPNIALDEFLRKNVARNSEVILKTLNRFKIPNKGRGKRIFNFIYVTKTWFYKDWTFEIEKGVKRTRLTPGQIEGWLHIIKFLRNKKLFKLSDKIRDRLVKIGYSWGDVYMLNPQPKKRLSFRADKDYVYLSGSVHIKDEPLAGAFDFEYRA